MAVEIDPLVIHSDLELHLTNWYRTALAAREEPICQDVVVDRVEPPANEKWPEKLVVIRDDGGPDTWFLTGERSVGVSCYAGSLDDPTEAKDLARMVHALRTQIPAPQTPVTAVIDSNGPYLVADPHPTALAYFPMTLAVVASAL